MSSRADNGWPTGKTIISILGNISGCLNVVLRGLSSISNLAYLD